MEKVYLNLRVVFIEGKNRIGAGSGGWRASKGTGIDKADAIPGLVKSLMGMAKNHDVRLSLSRSGQEGFGLSGSYLEKMSMGDKKVAAL